MESQQLLLQAVLRNDVETIDALVADGANVNHVDENDKTPLFSASKEGHVDTIRALIAAGANVNHVDNDGNTSLFLASVFGQVEAIGALKTHGADVHHVNKDGRISLFEACFGGHVDVIRALVNLGVNVNHPNNVGSTPLFWAAYLGKVGPIRALEELGANVDHFDKDGRTALFKASYGGNVDAIRALVELGANVNHRSNVGSTPLFWASSHGKVDAIRALAELDAIVNSVDKYGRTALFKPSHEGDVGVIRALFDVGADVNHANNKGHISLFAASSRGKIDAIRALVELGANVNHVDKDGRTALFNASHEGRVEAIEVLVASGANVNHVDKIRHTALSLYGHKDDVKKTLLALGAIGQPTAEDFGNASDKTETLRSSISFKEYIIELVNQKTTLGRRDPYNISFDTFSDDLKMGMLFRYGSHTVVSIYYKFGDSTPQVGVLEEDGQENWSYKAPICAGEGRVIYSKSQNNKLPLLVYENSIDLKSESEVSLCHPLSTKVEKNWGCFGRTSPGEYFIVYSTIPLRVFKVRDNTCSDAVVRKKEYPNFTAIEKMYVDRQNDGEDYGVFRGGTRGIEFGREYLFVGHVTLRNSDCFPNWFVQKNTPSNKKSYPRMYFMYFFTIQSIDGGFELSRMSSCFQPPSSTGTIHKIIFPCGIARRNWDEGSLHSDVVVSFGRDDKDCLVTSYTEAEVNIMLAPVSSWNQQNYVFHPNHAAALVLMWKDNLPTYGAGLIGISIDFKPNPSADTNYFNPAITHHGTAPGKFVTAWRKFTGSIPEGWRGYNEVTIEACSITIKKGKLVYEVEGEPVSFKAGSTYAGGEDPRLITENNCPLILVSTKDTDGIQRMYMHNLSRDDKAMAIEHPFCHSISGRKEKNWGPFYVDGILHFVYMVNPLIIGRVTRGVQCPVSNNIECETISEAPTPENLKEIFEANGLRMSGGTPGVRISENENENEYLFVGHSVQTKGKDRCFPEFMVQRFYSRDQTPYDKRYWNMYMAFFYTIEKLPSGGPWRLKRLSCCSQLPGKKESFAKIHFPAGLTKANLGGDFEDAFIVSFGDKDMHGGFCALNRKFLEYVLRPVETLNVNNYVVDVNYFQSIANLDPIDEDL